MQIDEVSEGGSVPLVRVTNRGVHDVLFLFGEEIRGAKQNRIANASFLVPARSELVIDVSCVEQGRWGRRGRAGFSASGEVVSHADAREDGPAGGGVAAPRRTLRGRPDRRCGRTSASGSRTSRHRLGDGLVRGLRPLASSRSERPAEAFRPLERQVGFVALIGDAIVGARGDRPAGGVRGALRRRSCAPTRSMRSTRRWAGASGSAPCPAPTPPRPSWRRSAARRRSAGPPSAWETISGSRAKACAGCALVAGQVVHLTAFPSPPAPGGPDAG